MSKIEELCIEISKDNETGEELIQYIQQLPSFDGYFVFHINDSDETFKEIVTDCLEVSIESEVKKLIDYKYEPYILVNTETEDYITANEKTSELLTYIFDNYSFTKDEERLVLHWIIDNVWEAKLLIQCLFETIIK